VVQPERTKWKIPGFIIIHHNQPVTSNIKGPKFLRKPAGFHVDPVTFKFDLWKISRLNTVFIAHLKKSFCLQIQNKIIHHKKQRENDFIKTSKN